MDSAAIHSARRAPGCLRVTIARGMASTMYAYVSRRIPIADGTSQSERGGADVKECCGRAHAERRYCDTRRFEHAIRRRSCSPRNTDWTTTAGRKPSARESDDSERARKGHATPSFGSPYAGRAQTFHTRPSNAVARSSGSNAALDGRSRVAPHDHHEQHRVEHDPGAQADQIEQFAHPVTKLFHRHGRRARRVSTRHDHQSCRRNTVERSVEFQRISDCHRLWAAAETSVHLMTQ